MKKYGYMCSIAFEHHVESDAYGTKIYASEKSLRSHCDCVAKECGIVKVKLKIVKVIQKENLYENRD